MSDGIGKVPAEDVAAIIALLAEFHFLIDQGRAGECIDLLAEGARFIFGPGSPNHGEIAGLEAIGAFLASRQAAPVTTRHLLGLPRLEVLAPDQIGAMTLLTLFKTPGPAKPTQPAAVADLAEIYVRQDGRWRLLVREVKPVDWTR